MPEHQHAPRVPGAQRPGDVVDAPVLRAADIGVAMGLGGTEVARQACGLALLDDDFATIVAAVREGRRICDNIRKFVRHALTGNTGEIGALVLAPLLGLPVPLLAAVALTVLLQRAVVCRAPLQRVFHARALGAGELAPSAAGALLVACVVELD